MPTPQPTRLISRDTHTTPLPGGVVEKALSLLATGTITERLRAAQLAHVEPLLGLVEVLAAAHHAGERHVAADEATPGLEPRRARVRGELSHSRRRVRFSERGLFL